MSSHACVAFATFIATVALCVQAFNGIDDDRVNRGGFYHGGKHYEIRLAPMKESGQ